MARRGLAARSTGRVTRDSDDTILVFVDGECGLCSRAVAWALARDRAGVLRPSVAQSDEARARVGPGRAAHLLDELHVWSGATGARSGIDAVIAILSVLPRWSWLGRVLAIPIVHAPARQVYRAIARARSRWFATPET